MAGLGLALPEEIAARQAAQAYGSTSPAATGPTTAPLPDVQPGIQTQTADEYAAPSWSDNPLGRIGFVLQSVAAGMNGQELPAQRLARMRKEEQASQMQKLSTAIGVIDHLNSIEDPEQRQQLATQIAPTLKAAGLDESILKPLQEMGPDHFQEFKDLVGSGDETAMHTLWQAGGRNLKGAIAAANSDFGKQILDDSARSTLTAKLADFQSQIEQHGEGDMLKRAWADHVLTMGEVEQINTQVGGLLSRAEMRVLRGDEALQRTIGITPQKLLDVADEADIRARTEARYRAPVQGPAPPELLRLQAARDAAEAAGDTRKAAEIQAVIDKQGTGANGGAGLSEADAWGQVAALKQKYQTTGSLTPAEWTQVGTLAARLQQVTSGANGVATVDPVTNLFGGQTAMTAGAAAAPGGTMPTDMAAPSAPAAAPAGPVAPVPKVTTIQGPKPQTMPDAALERVRGGVASLDQLNTMEKNLGVSGIVFGDLAKGAGALGLNQQANDFETARSNFRMSAQALIKGIPSDYDVQALMETIPDIGASEQTNRSRLKMARQITTDLLVGTLAYYKAQNFGIPEVYVERARQLGVNIDSIKPWDGKGDPLADAMRTTWQSMPTSALLTIDPSKLSADSARMLADVIRSKAGKK